MEVHIELGQLYLVNRGFSDFHIPQLASTKGAQSEAVSISALFPLSLCKQLTGNCSCRFCQNTSQSVVAIPVWVLLYPASYMLMCYTPPMYQRKEHLSSLAASVNRRSTRRQLLACQSVSAVWQLKRSRNSPWYQVLKTKQKKKCLGKQDASEGINEGFLPWINPPRLFYPAVCFKSAGQKWQPFNVKADWLKEFGYRDFQCRDRKARGLTKETLSRFSAQPRSTDLFVLFALM